MSQKIGYLGGDVSKGYADFVLLGGDLKPLEKVVQFDDTRKGHEALEVWIAGCVARHSLARVDCAVESTGGLEANWYRMLVALGTSKPVRAAILNPSVVKDASKAELNTNVSDAISARNIAMYLVRYGERVGYTALDTKYAGFRSVNNRIAMLNKQKTQVNNAFKQLLYQCFPEILRYCRRGFPGWVLLLLKEYPSPAKVSRARPETISKIKGITLEKANSLVALAKRTVASRQTDSDEFLIRAYAKDMLYLEDQLDDLKDYLTRECKGPEVDLLETIVGVGAYSAAVIMVEIEDIGRFAKPEKLVSYFGVNPAEKESGDKKKVLQDEQKGTPSHSGSAVQLRKVGGDLRPAHESPLHQAKGQRQRLRPSPWSGHAQTLAHRMGNIDYRKEIRPSNRQGQPVEDPAASRNPRADAGARQKTRAAF